MFKVSLDQGGPLPEGLSPAAPMRRLDKLIMRQRHRPAFGCGERVPRGARHANVDASCFQVLTVKMIRHSASGDSLVNVVVFRSADSLQTSDECE